MRVLLRIDDRFLTRALACSKASHVTWDKDAKENLTRTGIIISIDLASQKLFSSEINV